MASLPPNTPPAEVAAWNDYRSSLWQAFQNSYEDRWNQGETVSLGVARPWLILIEIGKWEAAVSAYYSTHFPIVAAEQY